MDGDESIGISMGCRLLTVVSIVSFVLLTALLVLWVRSFWASDRIRHHSLSEIDTTKEKTRFVTRYLHSGAGVLRLGYSTDLVSRNAGAIPDLGWKWEVSRGRVSTSAPYPRGLTYDRGRVLVALAGFEIVVKINDVPPIRAAWRQRWVRLPYWTLLPFLVPLPLWSASRWLRYRARLKSGRCVNCGYDLRESPDRCPECGAPAYPFQRKRKNNHSKHNPLSLHRSYWANYRLLDPVRLPRSIVRGALMATLAVAPTIGGACALLPGGGMHDVTDRADYPKKLEPRRVYRLTREARLTHDGFIQWFARDETGEPQIDRGDHIVPRGTRFRIDKIVAEDRGWSELTHYYGRILDGPLQGAGFDATMLDESHFELATPAATRPMERHRSN